MLSDGRREFIPIGQFRNSCFMHSVGFHTNIHNLEHQNTKHEEPVDAF